MPRQTRPRQTGLALGAEAWPRFRGGGFLHSLVVESVGDEREYPWSVPAIRGLARMEFHPAVTFFIGENGSGKSTLLEAIAVRCRFSADGGCKRGETDELQATSSLKDHLCLSRNRTPSDGWFLRAESFHNTATELEELDEEPFRKHGFAGYGGKSLHAQSHGEAFLSLLTNRLTGNGLHLFDEPEAALSPQRQLAVLTLLHRLVYHRSQLVIATHSPILLSYPHARIFEFSERGIHEVAYTETDHFRVTRNFLTNHERMLQLLLEEEEADLRGKER